MSDGKRSGKAPSYRRVEGDQDDTAPILKPMIHSSMRREQSVLLSAIDFQQPARRDFLQAVKWATALDSPLKILHIIKPPTDHSRTAPDSRYLRSLKTAALLDLEKLTRTARNCGASASIRLRSMFQVGCPEESDDDNQQGRAAS